MIDCGSGEWSCLLVVAAISVGRYSSAPFQQGVVMRDKKAKSHCLVTFQIGQNNFFVFVHNTARFVHISSEEVLETVHLYIRFKQVLKSQRQP